MDPPVIERTIRGVRGTADRPHGRVRRIVEDEEDDLLAEPEEDEEEEGPEEADLEEAEPPETSLDEILTKKPEEAAAADEEEDEESILSLGREERIETLSVKVVPQQPTEFMCRKCYLVKHRSQLADKARMYCRDCA
jgi:hypothetical protein